MSPAPFPALSDLLFDRLDRVVGCLGDGGAPRGYDPDDPTTLARWLKLMWHVVRASVPLLEVAIDRLGALPPSPFHADLTDYYVRHADEERDHDRWLEDDLAVLGVSGDALRSELPPDSIAAMVGAQYYLIRHYHPAVLLGYMALLEGYSVPPARVEELQARSAAPAAAWRTYLFHAREDPHHRADLCRLIDRIPYDPPTLARSVVVNALRTAAHYRDALDLVGSRPQPASTAGAAS